MFHKVNVTIIKKLKVYIEHYRTQGKYLRKKKIILYNEDTKTIYNLTCSGDIFYRLIVA